MSGSSRRKQEDDHCSNFPRFFCEDVMLWFSRVNDLFTTIYRWKGKRGLRRWRRMPRLGTSSQALEQGREDVQPVTRDDVDDSITWRPVSHTCLWSLIIAQLCHIITLNSSCTPLWFLQKPRLILFANMYYRCLGHQWRIHVNPQSPKPCCVTEGLEPCTQILNPVITYLNAYKLKFFIWLMLV